MDRDRRLDPVRDVSAEGRAGHGGRRATRRARVFGRASEHDGLVRAQPGEITMTPRRGFNACILAACMLAGGAPAGAASAAAAPTVAAPAGMAARGHRAETAGIDVVSYPTHVRDVVVVLGALPAGDAMAGTGNAAVPTLTGMMLDRGTTALDKFAIAERLEDVGASISFGVGTQSLEIRAKCLRKDLPMVLSILAAELSTPALPAAELAKAKQQLIGSLRESLQNTGARAQEAFARAVFPPGHPNRPHSVEDLLSATQSATLDEIKAFHAKYIGPKHLTLIFAGDVNDAAVRREVAKDFAGWKGGED